MDDPPRIGILGPLRLEGPEGEVPVRGTKLRMLLALLCLEAGHAVSTATIRSVLWDDLPPPTADNAVQVYIAGLRKLLRLLGDPDVVLETLPGGYRLAVPQGMLDRDVFLRARATAEDAARQGLYESAAVLHRDALAVWRGPALGELATTEGLAILARELDRQELDEFEAYAENELRLDRHRGLVAGLERRARQHPMRESLWALLAIALYRSDQQADALAVLRTIRSTLDAELGVEIGDRLCALEVAILRHDPSLLTEGPPVAEPSTPTSLQPNAGAPSGSEAEGSARQMAEAPFGTRLLDRMITDARSDLDVLPLRLELVDGSVLSAEEHSVLIGRDSGCDIVLAHPGISARHARITTTVHGHVIEDLLSTNGTFVNGVPVVRDVLAPGDRIEFGRLRARYL